MANTTASSTTAQLTPSLTIENGQVTTTSLQIAEHFGKRHDHVLRAIRNLECSADFRIRNFGETVETRENPSGGAPISSPAYRITRDGFVFLAMGFTGKEAAQWKEAYITAFNKMEHALNNKPKQQLLIDEPTIDPHALMLSGQSELTALIPDELHAAIDKKAWEMAGEAYNLSRMHLMRAIAYTAITNDGRNTINATMAERAISKCNLGRALAHKHIENLDRINNAIAYAANIANATHEAIQGASKTH